MQRVHLTGCLFTPSLNFDVQRLFCSLNPLKVLGRSYLLKFTQSGLAFVQDTRLSFSYATCIDRSIFIEMIIAYSDFLP